MALDKFFKRKYLLLFLFTAIYGTANGLLPFSSHLWVFLVLAFCSGVVQGALNAGVNVLCLDIWRGHDGAEAWMHAIHFSYGVGTLIAPILVKPFLTNKESDLDDEASENNVNEKDFGLKVIFPIMGAYTLLVSCGFLFFFLRSLKNPQKYQELRKNSIESVNTEGRIEVSMKSRLSVINILNEPLILSVDGEKKLHELEKHFLRPDAGLVSILCRLGKHVWQLFAHFCRHIQTQPDQEGRR